MPKKNKALIDAAPQGDEDAPIALEPAPPEPLAFPTPPLTFGGVITPLEVSFNCVRAPLPLGDGARVSVTVDQDGDLLFHEIGVYDAQRERIAGVYWPASVELLTPYALRATLGDEPAIVLTLG